MAVQWQVVNEYGAGFLGTRLRPWPRFTPLVLVPSSVPISCFHLTDEKTETLEKEVTRLGRAKSGEGQATEHWAGAE